MVGLPFIEEPGADAMVAPAVAIDVAGGGDSGGFGGVVDAASALLGGAAGPTLADHLVAMSLTQGMAPDVDELELTVAQTEQVPEVALGDGLGLRMGVAGALEALFSGDVHAMEDRSDGLRRYRIGNAGRVLANLRLNQTVSNMAATDVVSFLAGEAGLSVDSAVQGADGTLAEYVVDDGRSAWDHMSHLATLRGADVWVDGSGTVHLADALEDGDTVQAFTYGEDVLEASLWRRAPHAGQISVFGGARAADGFTLRKQPGPNRADGGDGAPQRFKREGALNAPEELGQRVAAVGRAAYRRSTASQLVLPGSAALMPAAVIEVANLPGGDARFLIRSTHHVFDRESGWRTRVWVSEAGEVPGFGGLLGGAPGGLP